MWGSGFCRGDGGRGTCDGGDRSRIAGRESCHFLGDVKQWEMGVHQMTTARPFDGGGKVAGQRIGQLVALSLDLDL